ncbi:MAG: hypothetical protein AABZ12_04910 [Planctomycetota bacterium]
MSSTSPIEVTVVFDASRGGRKRLRATRLGVARPGRVMRLALGLSTFIVVGANYYVAWWKVDPFLYLTMMMKTPVTVANSSGLSQAGAIFGLPPSRSTAPSDVDAVQPAVPAPPALSTTAAQGIIWGGAYGWLTLCTVALCSLGVVAGAMLRSALGGWIRAVGVIGVLCVGAGLAYGIYWELMTHGTFLSTHIRVGMGGVVALFVGTGLATHASPRRWARASGILTVFAALGTVAGIYLGNRADAIEPQYATPLALATAFAIHSAWGFVMLTASRRV